MIFRGSLSVDMWLNPIGLLTRKDELLEHAFEKAKREVVAMGEGHAFMVGAESVFAHVPPLDKLSPMDPVIMHATWSPDPTKGVELRSGALDGSILSIERWDPVEGWPMLAIRVPIPVDDRVERFRGDIEPTASNPTANYVLAGIDTELDRWVYEATS